MPLGRRVSLGRVLVALAVVWVAVHVGGITQAKGNDRQHGPVKLSTRPPAGLSFTDGAGCSPRGDYASAKLDRRVRLVLMAVAEHHQIRASCIHTGHSYYVKGTTRVSNHTVWRGVDIDRIDGQSVSPANLPARAVALWIGQGRAGVQPSEVGSPWDFGPRPWFTDSGHKDHIHVGFRGPTQSGGVG